MFEAHTKIITDKGRIEKSKFQDIEMPSPRSTCLGTNLIQCDVLLYS